MTILCLGSLITPAEDWSFRLSTYLVSHIVHNSKVKEYDALFLTSHMGLLEEHPQTYNKINKSLKSR